MGACWCGKTKHQSIDEMGLSPTPQAVVPEIQIWRSSTNADDETDDFRQRSTSEPTDKLVKKKQSYSVSGRSSDAGYEGSMSLRRSSMPHDHSHSLPQNTLESSDSILSYHTAPSNSPTRMLILHRSVEKLEEENNLLRKELAHFKEESQQLRKKLADMETKSLQESQRNKSSNTSSSCS